MSVSHIFGYVYQDINAEDRPALKGYALVIVIH
jgi:hypothetical protein